MREEKQLLCFFADIKFQMSLTPKPDINERPAAYSDRLSKFYSPAVSQQHKKKLGQFFTPLKIAEFMAQLGFVQKKKIRVLDPGCGLGVLSCAIIEKLIDGNRRIDKIELVAFESDNQILHLTNSCLEYLSDWIKKKNIKFTYLLCTDDFVLHSSSLLENKCKEDELYDLIISNPPYFKINKKDITTKAATSVTSGQNNIYSVFLLIAANLLKNDGKLVFLTPRSFSSGSYFRVFREKFFSLVSITNIHLFESRKEAFEKDEVLQENVIVVATRLQGKRINSLDISRSKGSLDLDKRTTKEYSFNSLVNLKSEQKIFHIPTTTHEDAAIKIFKSWSGSFNKYNIEISTGPVVDFRSLNYIRQVEAKGVVPLIYLHNIGKMEFDWPVKKMSNGKEKGQYILDCPGSKSLLVRNVDYILLRRFSSKDDKSKLVATPYFSSWLNDYERIGIENHVNYIYRRSGFLEEREVIGIAAILNSRLFDVYFRTFNGNINVSATELRDLPLPELKIIQEIGERLKVSAVWSQLEIDTLIRDTFNIDVHSSFLWETATVPFAKNNKQNKSSAPHRQ